MVEVIVAFTVLSIMMLLFAQGLAWATNTEARATNTRNDADKAMIDLQDKLAGVNTEPGSPLPGVQIDRYVFQVDGHNYVVYIND